MKMVNMAMTPEKQGEGKSDGCCCCGPCGCNEDRPRYPWGLQINLDGEQLDKLGIKDMPATGAVIILQASAKVTRCSEEESADGKPMRSISLQITDLGIEGEEQKPTRPSMAEMAKSFYGDKSGGMDGGSMGMK